MVMLKVVTYVSGKSGSRAGGGVAMRRAVAVYAGAVMFLASFAARADEISRGWTRWHEAAVHWDVAGMAALCANDVTLLPPGQAAISGREAVAAWLKLAPLPTRELFQGQFQPTNVREEGRLGIETGIVLFRELRANYVAIWDEQDSPSRLWRLIWNDADGLSIPQPPTAAARSSTAPPPLLAVSANPPVALPEPQRLSSGFIEDVSDQLNSRRRRIEKLLRQNKDVTAAENGAVNYLTHQIEAIGWIDLDRFGPDAECDAAFIVAHSGDVKVMDLTIPWMGKDLKNSAEGSGCYRDVMQAYAKLKEAGD